MQSPLLSSKTLLIIKLIESLSNIYESKKTLLMNQSPPQAAPAKPPLVCTFARYWFFI